ncbi:S26 family signal peptidase [Planobispora rosea]|uniref:S26 family signal peptidase n=1 Tax=Planobispora rosea TaxID=35762 RepID=A0A8J3WH64_PLARO|nr:S26 family signal peptidase [Planobispora rosea]GGT02192.1 S26 family signal peptidase [Planobispora rosea]GIH88442.1 S26 family signal peptidase [Planobispora rosea]
MTGWVPPLMAGMIVLGAAYTRCRLIAVTVVGTSMAPTFTGGERVLVRRTGVHRLRRGDVVVVRWTPPAPSLQGTTGELVLIKRVTAVAGDPVPAEVAEAAGRPVGSAVPAGAFVLIGDNVERSVDSRICGLFHAPDLLGIMVRRLGVPGSRR